MPNQCADCNGNPVDIAKNTAGTPTAKLIAILEAHGVTAAATLAEIVGISERAIRKARNCGSGTQVPGGTTGPELQDRSGTTVPKTELQDRNSGSALACADSNITNLNNNNTTPGETRERAQDADELHRIAYEAGLAIKGGKVAKSARAIQVAHGELDGARGIVFRGGKLSVSGDAEAELRADFPMIDIAAVANKAGPELRRFARPTYDDAMTVLRKWAQIATENNRSSSASRGEIVNFRPTGVRYAKPRDEVANA